MSINELTAVIEPPKKPLEAGPLKRWGIIQAQVGTKLPSDFRDFGRTFGTGKFLEEGISVFNPFAAVFPQWLDEGLAVWRSLRSAEGDAEVPYPVFPETPGLLAWGTDEGGSGC